MNQPCVKHIPIRINYHLFQKYNNFITFNNAGSHQVFNILQISLINKTYNYTYYTQSTVKLSLNIAYIQIQFLTFKS